MKSPFYSFFSIKKAKKTNKRHRKNGKKLLNGEFQPNKNLWPINICRKICVCKVSFSYDNIHYNIEMSWSWTEKKGDLKLLSVPKHLTSIIGEKEILLNPFFRLSGCWKKERHGKVALKRISWKGNSLRILRVLANFILCCSHSRVWQQ